MGDISENFDRSEFKCKCGCGRDNISMDLVNKLQRLRNFYGSALVINSGCRCIKHNADEGGKPDSAHICEGKDGEAVDLAIVSGAQLFKLLDHIFFYKLFNRVGIGDHLLHVDISKTLPQDVTWIYK